MYIGIILFVRLSVCADSCRPITVFGFTLAYHIWHMGLSPWEDVTSTFTFKYVPDLIKWSWSNLSAFFMSSCPTCNFCSFWHWNTIFGTWDYHHERMCQVYSWSWYDIDHWPQGQINRFYDMVLCSGLSFFVLQHSHTLICTRVYHHGTMFHIHSWTLYDLDLWPQYQSYFTMDLSLARCLCSLT